MLTKKQHELLHFLQRHLGQNGVSPSFDEMKDALGLKSKSGIHRLISGLEERGFIRRLPHRARAIEVLRLPEDLARAAEAAGAPAAPGEPPRTGFSPRVIQGSFGDALSGVPTPEGSEALHLPLYGRIAAGTPIEALRDNDSFVEIPATLLGSGDHYALEVEGDSMVDAGIMDGDTVVIERTETVENGSIAVALIDNEEATLKRIRRKGGAVALEPANARYETRIFPPERVRIQGRLVGLLRRY